MGGHTGGRHGDAWLLEIRTRAGPDPRLLEYLGNLEMVSRATGGSTIRGELADISAVYGVILALRDSGIQPESFRAERLQGVEGEGWTT